MFCRTFDAAADGYGRGEGVVVCVLGPPSSQTGPAAASSIILGTAVNQDGRSSGLTAPNGPSQTRLIRSALQAAQSAPSSVGLVALHGTGKPSLKSRLLVSGLASGSSALLDGAALCSKP